METQPAYMADTMEAEREIDATLEVLSERKRSQKERRFSIISFINAPEIERWLKLGTVGRFDLPREEVDKRRQAAYGEVEYLVKLVRNEPMGIQSALVDEPLPDMTFQLYHTPERTLLSLSPFRLGGELPSIQTGLAMVTADEQPVRLYERFVEKLWRYSRKGNDAVKHLQAALKRSGIKGQGKRT
jgi:hypothetical protein